MGLLEIKLNTPVDPIIRTSWQITGSDMYKTTQPESVSAAQSNLSAHGKIKKGPTGQSKTTVPLL